jgi:hypothetical protein
MPDDKSQGFTITDRRSFTDDGQLRPQPEPAPAPAPPPATPPAASGETPPASEAAPVAEDTSGGGTSTATGRRLPPVDFTTFVLSIGSSALINLGEAADPAGGASQKDLPMAKHTIDILSMLEDKTSGNLSPPEAQLLENLLFDLRLRYVSATKSTNKSK